MPNSNSLGRPVAFNHSGVILVFTICYLLFGAPKKLPATEQGDQLALSESIVGTNRSDIGKWFTPDMHFSPLCDKKFCMEWETLIAP
jgi:hypothetical protein